MWLDCNGEMYFMIINKNKLQLNSCYWWVCINACFTIQNNPELLYGWIYRVFRFILIFHHSTQLPRNCNTPNRIINWQQVVHFSIDVCRNFCPNVNPLVYVLPVYLARASLSNAIKLIDIAVGDEFMYVKVNMQINYADPVLNIEINNKWKILCCYI